MTHSSPPLHEQARRVIAGGVNSPVRSFEATGMDPLFVERGAGTFLYTVDGRRLVDFCLSWGPLILGHAHPDVVAAVEAAVRRGTSFGLCTEVEVAMARAVCNAMPSIERIRFVNSGTEATMTALRLARAFTGRDIIVKFDGCYHGHSDCLLVSAGSGVAGLPAASSAGVPASVLGATRSIPFNDTAALQATLEPLKARIAAVIMEPVPANMGVVMPQPGFLETVREMTARFGILLIFDEVITGFRLGLGGAQERFGVTPDLTCLGKIIGGGFPVGAVGGRAEIMEQLAPRGPVYQAGTLSGNPVAMSAGLATIGYLASHRSLYDEMEHRVARFAGVWREHSPLTINHVGSMFTIFDTRDPVVDFTTARRCDPEGFRRRFQAALRAGIYLPPAPLEAAFISVLHTDDDLAALAGA